MRFNDARLPLGRILTVGILPSPLKKLWYRLKGYRIGKGVSFGPGSVVEISGACEIGDHTRFGAGAVVVGETARFGRRVQVRTTAIVLVPHIEMGDDVIVSESAVIRAQQPFPDSRIVLGDRCHIFPYTIMDPSRPLTVGDETAVGFGSYIIHPRCLQGQVGRLSGDLWRGNHRQIGLAALPHLHHARCGTG